MPTKAGWSLLVLAGVVLAAGRILALVEFYLLGGMAVALLLAAVAWVAVRRVRLEITRSITPTRVMAGDAARVDLEVRNANRTATPVLRLSDAVSGTRGANLLLSPLRRSSSVRATYQLPTERRGVLDVGPLTVRITDPFGLARASLQAAGVSKLVVYPTVHRVRARSVSSGTRTTQAIGAAAWLNDQGDDFNALRQYVVGDDLRRVHWPSTARHDELMVRQDEMPQIGRTTIVLDVDEDRTSPEALDVAVSAAASLIEAVRASGDQVRLVSGDGTDTGCTRSHVGIGSAMEYLATVQPQSAAPLAQAIGQVLHAPGEATLVTITTELTDTESDLIASLSPHVLSTTSVLLDASLTDPLLTPRDAVASSRWIRVTRAAPFSAQWNKVFGAPIRVGR